MHKIDVSKSALYQKQIPQNQIKVSEPKPNEWST